MEKVATNRDASRALLKLAEGLFSHAIDFSLWLTVYVAELSLPRLNNQVWQAQVSADRFLDKVNYEVIKNALKGARQRGFIKKSYRHAPSQITAAGKLRLREIIPHYDEKRVWDGRIHLITYDIPEKQRGKRNQLRIFLISLGCAKLQESVWLTLYNPVDIIRKFVESYHLQGTIIVSDLGTNGAIGEENIIDLLIHIYGLEKLNERYTTWLENLPKSPDHWSILQYLIILKDDPQLPFPLLPSWWQGDKAYRKIKSQLKQ